MTSDLDSGEAEKTARLASVNEVLALVLQVDIDRAADVDRAATPEWDSLRQVELALTLEESFDVRFSADEIAQLTSSIAIAELVQRKRA